MKLELPARRTQPTAMRADGGKESRVRPSVVSITLSSRRRENSEPGKAGLGWLSPGELRMPREKRGTAWADPERQLPPPSITVDQLSITGMALVFNPGELFQL